MGSYRGRVALVALLATVSLATSVVAASPAVHVIADTALTGAAANAGDVRWASAGSVYLTTMAAGVLEIDLHAKEPAKTVFPVTHGSCSTCVQLGTSSRYMVTAFPAFMMAWKRMTESSIHNVPFDVISALDVRDDRLVFIGSRREEGQWAPDGAIAWSGTLSKDLVDLHPVLFSALGANAHILGECGFSELSAVRYLRDGSYVLVPGVEPGVFLYGADGKLLYTWQTDRLGFLDRCDVSGPNRLLYARDPEARYQWLNHYKTVDDIVPLPEGPALLLREVQGGSTKWSLLILRRNAPPSRIDIPIRAPSDVAFAKADIRGNRIAFLIRTYGEWRRGWKPQPARLIVAELQ
jgi:hypothetical protein